MNLKWKKEFKKNDRTLPEPEEPMPSPIKAQEMKNRTNSTEKPKAFIIPTQWYPLEAYLFLTQDFYQTLNQPKIHFLFSPKKSRNGVISLFLTTQKGKRNGLYKLKPLEKFPPKLTNLSSQPPICEILLRSHPENPQR